MGIERFLDQEGRISAWPKKIEDKKGVITYLGTKFEKGRTYSEKEVNEIILRWHAFNDHTLLRRELCEQRVINRTPDCRSYWIVEEGAVERIEGER